MTRLSGARRLGFFLFSIAAVLLTAKLACAQSKTTTWSGSPSVSAAAASPATMCETAIISAERRYGLPPHLLESIGLVETGRVDVNARRTRPWPWSVQANNVGHYFATKAEAIQWVQEAEASGITSVDVGCLQVNLYFHATAFDTLDNAFDPIRNVDYAARFLTQLHIETSDWVQATGFYHSRTPTLAAVYQQQVQRFLGAPLPVARVIEPVASPAAQLNVAWRSTLDEVHSPQSFPMGKSWDSLVKLAPSPTKPHKETRLFLASADLTMKMR